MNVILHVRAVGIGMDVINQHSVPWSVIVPFYELSIFDKEEITGCRGVYAMEIAIAIFGGIKDNRAGRAVDGVAR